MCHTNPIPVPAAAPPPTADAPNTAGGGISGLEVSFLEPATVVADPQVVWGNLLNLLPT